MSLPIRVSKRNASMVAQRVVVWIGLGSNLNHPVQQLELALAALRQLDVDAALRCSSFYLSKALVVERTNVAKERQPDYVNAVVQLQTTLSPQALLLQLQAIETLQGRVRDETLPCWSPRPLDLDILLYGETQIDTPELTVPHPGIRLREFVLYPMYELAPALLIPGLGELAALVKRCPRRGMKCLNDEVEEQDVERAS